MEAATILFEQNGFRDTGVDAIAASARVSKRTIYECFPDKHAILEAVLTEFTDRQFRRIAERSGKAGAPYERLMAIAEGIQRAAMDSHSVAMQRLQIAESGYLPTTARLARRGQRSAMELLCPPLSELGIADTDGVAALLYDMFALAPLHRRLTEAGAHPWDARERLDLLLKALTSGAEASA